MKKKYVVFNQSIVGDDGNKYCANVKYAITSEKDDFIYIGKNKFSKTANEISVIRNIVGGLN